MSEKVILLPFPEQVELWKRALEQRNARQRYESELESTLRARLQALENDENLTKKESRALMSSTWEQIRESVYHQLAFSEPSATSFETLPVRLIVSIGDARQSTLNQITESEDCTVGQLEENFTKLCEYYKSKSQPNFYINALKPYGIEL